MSTKQIHPNIATALAAAQASMSNATKNNRNAHFGTSYADLSSVRDVVVPALSAEGIAVIQHIDGSDGHVTVRTCLYWGEAILQAGSCTMKADGRNPAQALGAVTTYLRRYQLAAVGGIGQDDDDGNSSERAAPQPRQPQREAPRQEQRQQEAPRRGEAIAKQVIVEGQLDPGCPKCNGKMWNNVQKKLEDSSWRGPWFSCKDKTCKGAHWDPPPGVDDVGPDDDGWLAQESDRNGVRP